MHNQLTALLVAAVLLGGCVSEPVVDVYLVDIKPLPSTLFEQRAELKLRIQNLTETAMQGDGMDLKFTVNGRKLARGVSNENFEVPALADTVISIAVSSSIFDTLRQLLTISNRDTFTYGMRGKIFAPGLNKRFTRSGEITREELGALVDDKARIAPPNAPAQ